MESDKFGNNLIKKVISGRLEEDEIKLSTLWENQTVVIAFLRRFGCMLCRSHSKVILILSEVEPKLTANNIKLIAIGVEEFGVEEFVEGKFFTGGDLYIDTKKQIYKDLGYKRFNLFSMLSTMFSTRQKRAEAYEKGRQQNINYNLKGDGFQNGGLIIIKKGGSEIILNYKQERPVDFISNSEILKALQIQE